MPTQHLRTDNVWQQTKALLYKNFLIKIRNKKQSLQEVLTPLFLLFLLVIISLLNVRREYGKVNTTVLGSLDQSPFLTSLVGYTPVTNTTLRIMEKVSSQCFRRVVDTEGFADEDALLNASFLYPESFVGVVFNSSMSYQIRFHHEDVPLPLDVLETRERCKFLSEACEALKYWYNGFVKLQACIDAAIIQMKTNISVWEELKSIVVTAMELPSLVEIDSVPHAIISVYLVMSFASFVYFLPVNVVAEKEEKLKEVLKLLGLSDSAFWLSWGLIYIGFLAIMSLVMAVITTVSPLFSRSSCFVLFFLFFLYGLSAICFALMLTPMFKKPKVAGTVGFFFTLICGCLSLIFVLVEDFPKHLVWILSPFFPCTFSIGIAQVIALEYEQTGAQISNLHKDPYPLFITFLALLADSLVYILVAVYLEEVVPVEYGVRRSPFFFLQKSYWSKKRKNYCVMNDNVQFATDIGTGVVEPVPAEFQGKEAIRISNIHKTFREKDKTVHALNGLSFDIYEGQITALLGHSGAGKSTLMNILCGICPPSDGSAVIYNYTISEIDEMIELRKMVGICPQFDISFNFLTAEENLKTFAAIRGIRPKDVDQEVARIMKALDMEQIRDSMAHKLSGGQKRKLSLGIAILGDPKILFLDEPTSGMDVHSQHQVWNLLKGRKTDRVTVLSTHFMDEADILADRKAVISQGMLKCLGSSLFLKSKWGVGYNLSMHVMKTCDTDSLSSLIDQHIPNAKLSRQLEQELIFKLPLEYVDKFSGLFSDLESNPSLGIVSCGVSMTTLEDVFLKLEADAELDQADYSVFNETQSAAEGDNTSTDDMKQSSLLLSEGGAVLVDGMKLWRQQVFTVARLHFLNFKRESKAMKSLLLLFATFAIFTLLSSLINAMFGKVTIPLKLSPHLYLLNPEEKPNDFFTSLLVQNSTGSDIDDLLLSLKIQKVQVELFTGNDFMSVAPHHAALNVSGIQKKYHFTAAFNTTMVHSLPAVLNLLSNSILTSLNSSGIIEVWSKPFIDEVPMLLSIAMLVFGIVLLGIIAPGMLPYFAMENTEDRKLHAYALLRTSGLHPSAYWCGQAMVDIPVFLITVVLMTGSLFAFHHKALLHPEALIPVAFCIFGYAPAVVLFTYVISFIFRKVQGSQDFWSFTFFMVVLLAFITTEIPLSLGFDFVAISLQYLFMVFVPLFPLMASLSYLVNLSASVAPLSWKNYNAWNSIIMASIVPFVHCIILPILLRYLENKYGERIMRDDPVFRIRSRRSKFFKSIDVPCSEDEFEQADDTKEPVVIVKKLRKEYNDKKGVLGLNKKKKLPVKNVSFCVRKGEVLGLLGPNGAGKTTTIHLLTGEEEPTSGQVVLGRHSSVNELEDVSLDFIGYCPQVNPLWPKITLQEHMQAYAAIRGLIKEDAVDTIKRMIDALELKEHLQKPAKKLSAGIKRKLCFAQCMLGSPQVMLLDEPSTGMDPESKQRMWRAIRAACKSKQRGAILTTHYMAEAEAVCDRVAIMVSGELRCIGSVQHLKSKYGKEYILEVGIKMEMTEEQQNDLHKEILCMFPHAVRQDSYASLLVYKVPVSDVQSLSKSFSMLETAKHTFKIERYSFSQSSLQQVFTELVKEQEKENIDVPLQTSFQWQKLQQQEEC
ncbi:cholesterol transporter ABCA5-like [Protopterus annectens]|uniref:cholesterol transporter ABCA5-like n=1 Tax=Protopterus annectens TaxID=7888 RepID=UPI001CFB4C91|nr:cholesterol transporter ABCA5-like [Protopterus annectens]XP_043941107.1 cholesterol transporter ABCA5-like [Protopterus annectens]